MSGSVQSAAMLPLDPRADVAQPGERLGRELPLRGQVEDGWWELGGFTSCHQLVSHELVADAPLAAAAVHAAPLPVHTDVSALITQQNPLELQAAAANELGVSATTTETHVDPETLADVWQPDGSAPARDACAFPV